MQSEGSKYKFSIAKVNLEKVSNSKSEMVLSVNDPAFGRVFQELVVDSTEDNDWTHVFEILMAHVENPDAWLGSGRYQGMIFSQVVQNMEPRLSDGTSKVGPMPYYFTELLRTKRYGSALRGKSLEPLRVDDFAFGLLVITMVEEHDEYDWTHVWTILKSHINNPNPRLTAGGIYKGRSFKDVVGTLNSKISNLHRHL